VFQIWICGGSASFGKPVPDPHQSRQQSEKLDPVSGDADPQHFFYMNNIYKNEKTSGIKGTY
jgi:hypothetical protein